MKKIRIGIDIDEVLRAKWLQFDKYYAAEFGEDNIPESVGYTHDFFGSYPWNDMQEKTRYLKEPEDIPENINPLDYQKDQNENEAPADFAIFKPEEKTNLTAKDVYNRFMYEDYLLELHGSAPMMYKNMDLHINTFLQKYDHFVDFTIISKENWFSIPPTLFFLSKIMSRFKRYIFVDEFKDYWKRGHDLIITANPDVINAKPKTKKHIKLDRPYNKEVDSGEIKDILHLNDLSTNEEFEKLVKYKSKK